jgi:hypothetical protein
VTGGVGKVALRGMFLCRHKRRGKLQRGGRSGDVGRKIPGCGILVEWI